MDNSVREPLRTIYTYHFKGFKLEQESIFRFVKLITPNDMHMDTITLMNDEERRLLWEEAQWIG